MSAWIKATQENVFAVMDALRAKGQPITQRHVKEALGGGSYGTIGPLMRAWKAQNGIETRPVKAEIPAVVERAGKRILGELWVAALAESGRGLVEAEEAFARERLSLQQEAAESATLADAAEEKLAAMGERLAEMERLIAAKEQRAEAETEARHQAETEKARAEVKAEGLVGELARSESMVLRQEQRAEAAERSAARAEVRAETLEASLAAEKTALEAAQAALRAMEERQRSQDRHNARLEAEVAALEARLGAKKP